MATVKKFEDLISWQKARLLTKEIYKALRGCQDYGFKDQIQRASVSVMSNIAEGFERGTKQELINYFFIAKGSASEVRAQLYAAYDIGYLNVQTFTYLHGLVDECSRLLASFINKVKAGSKSGLQYRHVQKKDMGQEFLNERGLVFTARGVMKREEAEERGLEIL